MALVLPIPQARESVAGCCHKRDDSELATSRLGEEAAEVDEDELAQTTERRLDVLPSRHVQRKRKAQRQMSSQSVSRCHFEPWERSSCCYLLPEGAQASGDIPARRASRELAHRWPTDNIPYDEVREARMRLFKSKEEKAEIAAAANEYVELARKLQSEDPGQVRMVAQSFRGNEGRRQTVLSERERRRLSDES